MRLWRRSASTSYRLVDVFRRAQQDGPGSARFEAGDNRDLAVEVAAQPWERGVRSACSARSSNLIVLDDHLHRPPLPTVDVPLVISVPAHC
ncbi:hypothetical protein [Haliangium sp.]|uniref:hypothetical protein n=1 Tax=Haliangium sp. TaxID=2663208 RepID=UPI003D128EE9